MHINSLKKAKDWENRKKRKTTGRQTGGKKDKERKEEEKGGIEGKASRDTKGEAGEKSARIRSRQTGKE